MDNTIHCFTLVCKHIIDHCKKGKAIPVNAWTGPEGSRRLSLYRPGQAPRVPGDCPCTRLRIPGDCPCTGLERHRGFLEIVLLHAWGFQEIVPVQVRKGTEGSRRLSLERPGQALSVPGYCPCKSWTGPEGSRRLSLYRPGQTLRFPGGWGSQISIIGTQR